jgi:hypothetical protein
MGIMHEHAEFQNPTIKMWGVRAERKGRRDIGSALLSVSALFRVMSHYSRKNSKKEQVDEEGAGPEREWRDASVRK